MSNRNPQSAKDLCRPGQPLESGRSGRVSRDTALRILLTLVLFSSGCQWPFQARSTVPPVDTDHYRAASTRIEYPELEQPTISDVAIQDKPVSLSTDISTLNYWNLSLEEVVRLGLENSKIMRNLGTTILRSPDAVTSSFDPAIAETDPRFGIQAALSAFDTSFAASVFHQNNDRALNNQFFGGGTRLLQQQATVMQGQLSKRSASGSEFFVRSITDHDRNNAPGNAFPGAWTQLVEAEMRQPLLRGYGVEYWQTVGASQTPGVYNGVLIARTHADISQSEFEISVRDFIAELENSYWDLYYAYQDLDAKIAARDASLELWRRLDALNQLGRAGGEADKEAQAREQYFRFEEDVQNALNGKPVDGSRTHNGTSAGAFKGTVGILTAERRLRYLAGLPINDGRIIRPQEEPLGAPVEFHWESVLEESLQQRPELRRQQWVIKQKELELVAAEKMMLPDLDVVALYRFRGFGEALTDPMNRGNPRFHNAWGDLASGNFQEWQLGMELNVPLGNRRAHTGLRNAEFQLARARQVLRDQERLIVHDLSNSVSEVERAWNVLKTVKQRLQAAEDQVHAMVAAFEADQAPVNLVLEAQRRHASARSAYYAAVLDYNFAVRNVHFEKGTYLDYCGVFVSEGEWKREAHENAARMARRNRYRDPLPPFVKHPHFISSGDVPAGQQRIPLEGHLLEDQPWQFEEAGENQSNQQEDPFGASSSEQAPWPNTLPVPSSDSSRPEALPMIPGAPVSPLAPGTPRPYVPETIPDN